MRKLENVGKGEENRGDVLREKDITYLGVYLDDRKGSMEGRVRYRMGLIKLRLGGLFPVLRLDSRVDTDDTRMRILKMIVQPMEFLGMEVLGSEKTRQKNGGRSEGFG